MDFGEASNKFFAAPLFAMLRHVRSVIPDIQFPTSWNIDDNPAAHIEMEETEEDLVKVIHPIMLRLENELRKSEAEAAVALQSAQKAKERQLAARKRLEEEERTSKMQIREALLARMEELKASEGA